MGYVVGEASASSCAIWSRGSRLLGGAGLKKVWLISGADMAVEVEEKPLLAPGGEESIFSRFLPSALLEGTR